MKRPRKVALINVFDYPREVYSAYWEIDTTAEGPDRYRCRAVIRSYTPVVWSFEGKTTAERPAVPWPTFPPDLPATAPREQHDARRALCEQIAAGSPVPQFDLESMDAGTMGTQEAADEAAQTWVLDRIDKYRRDNAPVLSDAEVERLVTEFDLARGARDLARVDRIRGRLKASGVLLAESAHIGDNGKTAWKRG